MIQPPAHPSNRPFVSVIVPTYHDWPRVAQLCEALKKQTLEPDRFEVVIVNNDRALSMEFRNNVDKSAENALVWKERIRNQTMRYIRYAGQCRERPDLRLVLSVYKVTGQPRLLALALYTSLPLTIRRTLGTLIRKLRSNGATP